MNTHAQVALLAVESTWSFAHHSLSLLTFDEYNGKRVTFESDTLKSVSVQQMGTDNNNWISWITVIVKVFVVKPM